MASQAMAAQDEAAADVAVAKRVEAMLKHEGLNLKGSSDTQAWAAPSEFWQDSSYRATWYSKAIAYWENNEEVPATVDGVLGGFAVLDAPDVRASRRFLTQARDAAGQSGEFVAADVAAGIGRVTKHVLLPCGAASVDVLEPARTLREAAFEFVDAPATVEGVEVGAMAAKCRFLAAPMQDWAPSSSSYDVIWAQWCVAVWNQSYATPARWRGDVDFHTGASVTSRTPTSCASSRGVGRRSSPGASSSSKTTAASRHRRTTASRSTTAIGASAAAGLI